MVDLFLVSSPLKSPINEMQMVYQMSYERIPSYLQKPVGWEYLNVDKSTEYKSNVKNLQNGKQQHTADVILNCL